jgi:hypothetical protein
MPIDQYRDSAADVKRKGYVPGDGTRRTWKIAAESPDLPNFATLGALS